MATSLKQVNQWLISDNISLTAAEAHARVLSAVIVQDEKEPSVILQDSIVKPLSATANDFWQSWKHEVRQQLLADDYSFSLMLVDDEASLPEKIAALAQWSESFLTGIAGVINQDMSEEEIEAINHIYSIARLDVDDDMYKDKELDFIEVLEYTKLSIINFADEQFHP